mmetsp:Transcript_6784/g.21221  ORF Transcript_6784/g.21221 Transcript_6784/m.21221 type:complete len:368 (-) Transcript_6784:143-1246(-)
MQRALVDQLPPTEIATEDMEYCTDQPVGQMESGSWRANDLSSELQGVSVQISCEEEISYSDPDVPAGPCIEARSRRRSLSVGGKHRSQQLPHRDMSEDLNTNSGLQISTVEVRQHHDISDDPICFTHKRNSKCNILGWQQELVECILAYLRPIHLFRVALTCNAGRKSIDSPSLWTILLLRDYPNPLPGLLIPHTERHPKERYQMSSATAAVFVTGGCSSALAPVSEVHRYALGTHRVSRVASLAGPRVFAAVCRVGGRVFVSGGCTSLSTCLRSVEALDLPDVYDLDDSASPSPLPHHAHGAADEPPTARPLRRRQRSWTGASAETVRPSWSAVPDMHWERSGHCMVAAAGRLYVVGGTDLSGGSG